MSNPIIMNGDATGYGAQSGSESWVLNNYGNTVLLAGADDSISVASGGDDTINLNATGFTWGVTDSIDLGQAAFTAISAGSDLWGSDITATGGYGDTHVGFTNHDGTTSLSLGNAGVAVNGWGLGQDDVVSLNGDASNSVTLGSGSGADIAIGAAGDGFFGYTATVALAGTYDLLLGGDENFTVTGADGLAHVQLGNGDNSVTLGGTQNALAVGGGDNTVAFSGAYDIFTAGTGSNSVTDTGGHSRMVFGAGGAGATDTIALGGGVNIVTGGNENFTIAGIRNSGVTATLGNGNDVITIGGGKISLGTSRFNSASDTVTIQNGSAKVTINGGTDQVNLLDARTGFDTVVLNGSMLGSALTANGSFDAITLANDANVALTETSVNGGMTLTLDGDASGGIGTVSVYGFAQDDMARINLVGCSSYTITEDNTPQGGLTLTFASGGSLDLIGLQSLPNGLIHVI
jgi:hypothetical protein